MWKNARTVEEGVLRNWDVTGVALTRVHTQLWTYGLGWKTWFRGTRQLWIECEWARSLLSMQLRTLGIGVFMISYHVTTARIQGPWKYPFWSQWSCDILKELTVTPVFREDAKMYLGNWLYYSRKPRWDSLKVCRMKRKRGIVCESVCCEGLNFLHF